MWDPAHKRVLVLGLGLTGRSAANYCAARGAHVVAADEGDAAALSELASLDARVEQRVGTAFPDHSIVTGISKSSSKTSNP